MSPRPPPLLIVNADDFGLTKGISTGILRAHRQGIVTSTSALAIGPAYPKVAHWLANEPDIGVGVHLAAVGEDPPLLSAREIPTLLSRRGHLSRSYKGLLARLVAGRVDPGDVEREFQAQLELVRELGVPLTHLDAHQHLHLWPPVGGIVLALGRRYAIPAVRVPRHRGCTPLGLGVSVLARRLARAVAGAGMNFAQGGMGIEVAGRLDQAHLQGALARMALQRAPSFELTVHPGEPGDPDRGRYRWGYRWEEELEALTSAAARAAVARHGFRLGTYADLGAPAGLGKLGTADDDGRPGAVGSAR